MNTKNKPDNSAVPLAEVKKDYVAPTPVPEPDVHAGRRYSVGTTVKKGKRKLRYVETNDPKKGCRFL